MSMSLDGFIADPDGDSSSLYPDIGNLRNTEAPAEMIEDTGAVVMGRHSYDMGDTDEGYVDYEHHTHENRHQIPRRALIRLELAELEPATSCVRCRPSHDQSARRGFSPSTLDIRDGERSVRPLRRPR